LLILIVLGFGEAWTLIALALDLRQWIGARQNPGPELHERFE
jgi:hypothetical protein